MKINTKKLKYGTAATVITIAVIAVVILINVIITLFADRVNMSFDLTPNKDFAITEETKSYLASLTEKVEICTTVDESYFQTADNKYFKQAYEVLKKYAMGTDKIDLKFIDMTVDPTYVEKYKEYYNGSISENSIVLFNEDAKRVRVISVNDLFNIEMDYNTGSRNISSQAEKVLTSAIMYITDPDPKTAVYLDVASQSTTGENIRTMLEDDGFEILTVDPLTEELPMDADLIIINSPLNDFSEELVDKLYNFMENGGNYGKNMIYLASTFQNATPNIDAFLDEWGIKVSGGVVSDTNTQNLDPYYGGYGFAAFIGDSGVVSSGDGGETSYLGGIPEETLENPIAVYYARPIELLFDHSGNVSVYSLLNSAETGFVYTDEMGAEYEETGKQPAIEEKEIPLIALSNKYTFIDNEMVLSNLLVLGTDEMLSYSLTSQTYYNNGDYFISIVNKISGKESGVSIVDKDLAAATFQSSVSLTRTMRIVFMVVIPAAVIIIGVAVWLRRRHR